MDRMGRLILAFLLAAAWASGGQEPAAKAPDFRLVDTAGQTHTMSDYAGKTIVFVFWSFKCPVVLGYNTAVAELQSKYNIAVVGVDSNSNETALEIKRNVENLKLGFPVLIDSDGDLAERLGATHTPSAIVVDATHTLRYRGGLEKLEDNIKSILSGHDVPSPKAHAAGCLIKRR